MGMTIYNLKPGFQRLLRPVCQWLADRGVTANQITVLALVLSVVTGLLFWWTQGAVWVLWLVPLVLFLRMALNAVDGMLAREHGMKTALGALLNELGDVLSDIALYLPFAVFADIPGTLLVIVVVLAVVCEMTGVLAVTIGASRRYDGPMGKSDRAFVFGFLAIVLALGVPGDKWLFYLFIGLVFLLIITIGNRMRRALQELGQ